MKFTKDYLQVRQFLNEPSSKLKNLYTDRRIDRMPQLQLFIPPLFLQVGVLNDYQLYKEPTHLLQYDPGQAKFTFYFL